ncbi:hypothetical protein [Streptococcus equinus]|uniref:Bacterial membrane protein YfhO n=1 Tax=Streptococcus equinus ATCC 9812 TaxID=525379 RepID=E8JMS0_STREI|nr:hypothetical protein [Streptococcus equinus]EFW89685.1 hypothetical protein HMPREF0819_0293 [Streptococcus equinus ATCC 9812]SUN56722.1 membrane protein [Streptococcus equinus]
MFKKMKQGLSQLSQKSTWLPSIVILVVAFLLLLPQIMSRGVIAGSDFLFHYNRFYETAMQLKTGNFSYFISLYGFYSSGRIVNALYGPYFAYFQGLLVLISKNWYTYQLLSRFLLSVIAGFSMYRLNRRALVKPKIALGVAAFYMMTFSVQYWTFRQGFSSWGAAFMPWCLIPAVDFIRTKKVGVLRLAVAVAVMMQVHMLSCFLLIVAYLPFYLYGFFKSAEKKEVFVKGVQAVLLSLLLTANVWAALIDVGRSNNLVEPFINSKLYIMTVNQRSIEWLLTPKALVLVLLYQLYFSFRHWRHFDQLLRAVTGAFFLFLVLSSSIFPWYTVNQLNLPLVNLIQFPFRFFVPATVLLLLAATMVLDRYFDKKWSKIVTVGLIVVNVLSLAQLSQLQSEKIDEYYNTKYPIQRKKHTFIWGNPADVRASFYDSDKFKLLDIVSKSTPDYLPADKSNKENKYVLYEEFVLGHTDLFKKTQGDNELTFTWYADTSDWAIIPAVKYKDTELTLNGKKLSDKDYSLSGIGTPTVMQKAGKNTLTITYHISTWFKALIVVNILSWLATLAYLIKKKR